MQDYNDFELPRSVVMMTAKTATIGGQVRFIEWQHRATVIRTKWQLKRLYRKVRRSDRRAAEALQESIVPYHTFTALDSHGEDITRYVLSYLT